MSTILTLHDPQIARRYYADGYWRARHALQLCCGNTPRRGRTRMRCATAAGALTWQRARCSGSTRVAADLHAAGLKRGQRVSVWLPNRVEAVVVLLACSRNGYVCNPSLHQNYTVARDRAAHGAHTERGALRAAGLRRRCEDARRLRGGAGAAGDEARLCAGAATRQARACRRLRAVPGCGATPATLPPPDDNPDKIVYLAFTSGTTGTPKGVLHSDNTLLANGRAMVHDWHHDERTVLYSHSPLSHHIGTVALEQSLVAGCEVVVNDLPPGMKPLDWITRNRRDVRDGRADARDRHPRGHEAAAACPTLGAVNDLLHGGLDHSAGDGARVSRHGREAAEHLRHDRERLAPVHAAGRRRRRRSRPPAARRAPATRRGCGTRRTRTVEARTGRDRRDRHARRAADARLLRQPGGDRELVQRRRLVHERRSRPLRRAAATCRSSGARRT